MTIDNLKNSWRPATPSPVDPTGKAAERMREYRRRRRRGCQQIQNPHGKDGRHPV